MLLNDHLVIENKPKTINFLGFILSKNILFLGQLNFEKIVCDLLYLIFWLSVGSMERVFLDMIHVYRKMQKVRHLNLHI